MKVILKESVENLGTVGDLVMVKNGYARNYLIPRGIAIVANTKNTRAIEHERKALEKKRRREMTKVEELAKEVEGTRLVFQRRAADQDHLFGSVTHIDVEAGLRKKGFNVSRKQIALDHPIKSIGEFEVTLKFPGGVKSAIQVVVEKEAEA